MADLASLLESEASAEIEAILGEARQRADGIVKAAEEQAKSVLEGRRRALENALQATITRAKSSAELESAALKLSANHGASEQAFSSAQAELKAFTKSAEYEKTLQKLITEVKNVVGNVTKLEVNPADVDVAKRAASAAGVTAQVHANPDIETGVRGYAEGGSSSVTNTLLGRLSRARDGLLSDVAKVLGN
ncbi:MAG: V-type ATP synthase subunit E [Pleurocapsa sp. SU_196_0]|nr:V-type ATP synthase subunit E [Pleurocapsa sp. SU_196_0]